MGDSSTALDPLFRQILEPLDGDTFATYGALEAALGRQYDLRIQNLPTEYSLRDLLDYVERNGFVTPVGSADNVGRHGRQFHFSLRGR